MKYLVRGAISPLTKYIPDILAKRDIIGTNSGNLLYLYSVCRSIYNDNTSLVMDGYKPEAGKYTDEDIEKINQTYDAYICPLADAFRDDFIEKLKNYVKFFKKLRIPVVIIGLGLRAPIDITTDKMRFKFDDAVREFISEIKEHGEYNVGLRGDITGEYLKKLGFKEEKDFTVIGCPSLYSKGNHLPKIEKPNITNSSKILVNTNYSSSEAEAVFIDKICRLYSNAVFVGQHMDDFNLFYFGLMHHENLIYYPNNLTHFMVRDNRMRFYVSALQWYKDVEGFDLSIGHRLHGNVASLDGGVPAILLLTDARSLELSEYHGIPVLNRSYKIQKTTMLRDVLEQVDFSQLNKVHSRNFNHYLDFLEKNGIDHVYKNNRDLFEVKLDRDVSIPGLLKPYIQCNPNEAIVRQSLYSKKQMDRNIAVLKQLFSSR